jgi:hypothetical protein
MEWNGMEWNKIEIEMMEMGNGVMIGNDYGTATVTPLGGGVLVTVIVAVFDESVT